MTRAQIIEATITAINVAMARLTGEENEDAANSGGNPGDDAFGVDEASTTE